MEVTIYLLFCIVMHLNVTNYQKSKEKKKQENKTHELINS